MEDEIVAVLGVGGTGSYLVDILAKTNIKELHLFDNDIVEQHTAFRIAGAVTIEEIEAVLSKVTWHKQRYSPVREQGIFIYETKIDVDSDMDFTRFTTVFIALDDINCRRWIQSKCNDLGVFHVAVGLAVEIEGENNDQLGGMVKIENGLVPKRRNIDISNAPLEVYGLVQTAELNMLSAALAIIEWKTKLGIYRNERDEYDSVLYSSTTGDMHQIIRGETEPQ